jgi:hypothetical protein
VCAYIKQNLEELSSSNSLTDEGQKHMRLLTLALGLIYLGVFIDDAQVKPEKDRSRASGL